MDNHVKGKLLKTAGWITVGIGLYIVYKGTELDIGIPDDGIIDAIFEVVDD